MGVYLDALLLHARTSQLDANEPGRGLVTKVTLGG
jgi:hypothetical protein